MRYLQVLSVKNLKAVAESQQPCYNPARLVGGEQCCQAKTSGGRTLCNGTCPQAGQQRLSEDRRRGAAGRALPHRDSHVGKPGAGASAAYRQPVPTLHARRCPAAEAGQLSAKGARHECAGDCADSEARGPGPRTPRRDCPRHRHAPAAVATEAAVSLATVAKAAGISVGFLSAIERSQMSASVSTLRKLARYYKTNILDFYDTAETNSTWSGRKPAKFWKPGRGSAWSCLPGEIP